MPPIHRWHYWLRKMAKNPRIPAHCHFTAPGYVLELFHVTTQDVFIKNGTVTHADTGDVLGTLPTL